MNELFSIEGKRVLMAGGARGIGGGTARYLARQGALIVTFDIRDELASMVAKEATEEGPGRVTFRHVDILNPDEITAGVEYAVGELGGLDALITCHGGPLLSPAEETSLADWDWQLQVNSRGTGLLCQAVFPHLKEKGGSIVNVAAGGALKDGPIRTAPYSASKGAIISYTRSIALEWAKYNIRCNCVNPVVQTERDVEITSEMTPEDRAKFEGAVRDKIPLGHFGDVETELAPVFQFLISPAAKFITSQIYGVDGGLCPSR